MIELAQGGQMLSLLFLITFYCLISVTIILIVITIIEYYYCNKNNFKSVTIMLLTALY